MQDGATTNGATIRNIYNTTLYLPNKNFFSSHTLYITGKVFSAPNINQFQKDFKICILNYGKLTNRFKSESGESAVKLGGNWWWVKF